MAIGETVIDVAPGSELDRALAAADHPVVLVRGGGRYRIEPDESTAAPGAPPAARDIWAGYDPEKLLAGVLAAAGGWREVDADKLIEDIYRWREEGSGPWRNSDPDAIGPT